MKQTRAITAVAIVILGMFSLSLSYSLYCLYRSLTGVSVRGRTDVQTAALLASVRERLKVVKNQKEAEIILRSLDGIPNSILPPSRANSIKDVYGLGQGPDGGNAKKSYTIDGSDLQKAKEDALGQLFGFYRIQVVKRNLAIASLISGLIVEGHGILLRDQNSDVYVNFIRKAKEQLELARGMTNGVPESDQILERIRQVDQSLTTFANANKQQQLWERSRDDLFKNTDRIISDAVTEITGRLDQNIDGLQRDFLVAIFLFLSSIFGSVIFLFMAKGKVSRWFRERTDILSKYLNNFGRNEESEVTVPGLEKLEREVEWSSLLAEVRKAEGNFRARAAAESALSKCFGGPFVVFSPARKAVYWNSQATRLLNINSRYEVDELAIQDLFARAGLSRKKESLNDFLKQFESGKEAYLQLEQRMNGNVIPIEVSVFPLLTGVLKGGFVVVFREMRDEERRISERLLSNFQVVDKLLESIFTGEAVNVDLAPVPEQVIPLVEKLRALKVKTDEREALWAAEINAILEQVRKEEEFLKRFADEMQRVQQHNQSLREFSDRLLNSGSELQTFTETIERNLARGQQVWERLAQDLGTKSKATSRAVGFEAKVREVVNNMTQWNKEFRNGIENVRKCKDWIRLHAVNLNVGGTSESPEVFRDRARKFSLAMSEFCERVERIEKDLQIFIDRHPGSSVVPVLEEGVNLAALSEELEENFVALQRDVEAWRTFGGNLRSLFKQSQNLSDEFANRRKEIDLLRENCARVNESAIKELQQWH